MSQPKEIFENTPANREQLYAKNYSKMLGLALKFLRDPETAKDAVQNAFIKTELAKAPTLNNSYLLEATYHCAIDEIRRQKMQAKYLDLSSEILDKPCPHPGPEESAVRKEQSSQLTETLKLLSSRYKKAIQLSDIDGLDYHEAAQIMGVTYKTFKSLLHRARISARELILEKAA